jgi:predicted RNA binding protein YcfA (HicA-like mRNA interferase family)
VQTNILLKSGQIVKVLKKMGFAVVKTQKSHRLLINEKGKRTTIPSKNSTIISPILLKRILKDVNIELNDFLNNL